MIIAISAISGMGFLSLSFGKFCDICHFCRKSAIFAISVISLRWGFLVSHLTSSAISVTSAIFEVSAVCLRYLQYLQLHSFLDIYLFIAILRTKQWNLCWLAINRKVKSHIYSSLYV